MALGAPSPQPARIWPPWESVGTDRGFSDRARGPTGLGSREARESDCSRSYLREPGGDPGWELSPHLGVMCCVPFRIPRDSEGYLPEGCGVASSLGSRGGRLDGAEGAVSTKQTMIPASFVCVWSRVLRHITDIR